MDIFEYLPQLIVAYDGNDEFANLIHVKKANKDNNYFCPCCGGIVKPRALDSTKEQSHYYHITGKCTKESQLHFFCKNWLFEKGSKFYIDEKLFEVDSIEIEKPWSTKFGDYKPDVTVYATSGKTIYFEMFFSNRKTGDDYFCKWDDLGNDVVEVNIKEYMFKTDNDVIPSFTYLYHDGACFSKPYVKKDLYANTIAKIKNELTRQKVLNYKARIEQLDWFWQKVRNNNSKEEIINAISDMEYDDMISCYEIIKRKQCVSYIKSDVLNMINQRVISEVRDSLNLPYDENIYFDLEHTGGRTYKAGIRLDIKTDHIICNKLYSTYNNYSSFNSLIRFPKIVFSKSILNKNEIHITSSEIMKMRDKYKEVLDIKESIIKYDEELADFEKNSKYKVRVNNDLYTVVGENENENYETILDKCFIPELNIKALNYEIEKRIKEVNDKKLMDSILSDPVCQSLIKDINQYKNFSSCVDFKYDNKAWVNLHIGNTTYHYYMDEINIYEFISILSEYKNKLDNLNRRYCIISNLVDKVNSCKNNIWLASISTYYDNVVIKINQKIFGDCMSYTGEKYSFSECNTYSESEIKKCIADTMCKVMKNMEHCGCRVLEVRDEKQ